MSLEIDKLKLYFRQDIVLNKYITLKQPTIGEIIQYGEQKYFTMIYNITSIPSDMKSILFDSGIDYEEISDFELFSLLIHPYKSEDTSIIFNSEIDFSKMKLIINPENDTLCLINTYTGAVIDEHIYQELMLFFRTIHNIKPKIEKAANKFTKKILIDEDRDKRKLNKDKPFTSILLPIISSLINSQGFKYNSKDILNIGLYELMDSVNRINVIKQTDLLMGAIYGGTVDSNKISKSELNWMRAL